MQLWCKYTGNLKLCNNVAFNFKIKSLRYDLKDSVSVENGIEGVSKEFKSNSNYIY